VLTETTNISNRELHRLCHNWTHEQPLPEPLIEEKEAWGVSSKGGTLWKDYRTKIQTDKENEKFLSPLWVDGLEKAYTEAKQDEETKHRRRQLTLAKFRKRRLENTLKEYHLETLKRNPIIFTPNKNTPFNPLPEDVNRSSQSSARIEELSVPIFRPMQQTPNGGSVCNKSHEVLQKIKNLKGIRKNYHWLNQIELARSRPGSGYSSSCSSTYPLSTGSTKINHNMYWPVNQSAASQYHLDNNEIIWSNQFQIEKPNESLQMEADIDKFERKLKCISE